MRTDELQRGLHVLAAAAPTGRSDDALASIVRAGRGRRQRRRSARVVVALLLVSAGVATAAAVDRHGSTTNIEAVAATQLRTAAATTSRAGTARLDIAIQSNAQGDVQLAGSVDFEHGVGELTGAASTPEGAHSTVLPARPALQVRWLDGVIYIRIGAAGSTFGTWTRYNPGPLPAGTASGPAFVALPNVASLLRAFDAVPSTAVTIGNERLDGVPVVHKRVTSQSKRVTAALSRALLGPRDGTGPIVLDYWVDGRRHLVKVTLSQSEEVRGARHPFRETLHFSHFGVGVSVDAPPANDVTPGELTTQLPDPTGRWKQGAAGTRNGVYWQFVQSPATNGGVCNAFVFDPALNPSGDGDTSSGDEPANYSCGPPMDVFKALVPIDVLAQGHSAAGYNVLAGITAADIRDLRVVWNDGTNSDIPIGPRHLFVFFWRGERPEVSRIVATEGHSTLRCARTTFYLCAR
ncbi:MAG: LppX LprAFG lipoprotein [Actinomycetia bacterium]|nr:LppX LprAFG lipoprotein [Actinomycetes bacterium]